MKNEATTNATEDAQRKEKVDKLNEADAMIFQTEKQLKEYGEKKVNFIKLCNKLIMIGEINYIKKF